jgi:addiction module HigA family antidote
MEFNQKIFHPGETLAERLDEMNLTPKQFSKLCGIRQEIIEEIIDGRRDIDNVIAMLLDDYTGISNLVWLKLQKQWNDSSESIKHSINYEEYNSNIKTNELLIVLISLHSFSIMFLLGIFIWMLMVK